MLQHAETFVRCSALVATAELLQALPPSVVAGALLEDNALGGDSTAQLTERLNCLNAALREECEASQADETRQRMAGGCLALQAQLADGAALALEADAGSSGVADLLGGRNSGPEILLPPW